MASIYNFILFVIVICSILPVYHSTVLYRRKPILNYLIRYRLGHLKSKLHGHRGGFYGGYPTGPFGHTGLGHSGFGYAGPTGLGHIGPSHLPLGPTAPAHLALGHLALASHPGYGHSGLGHTGPGFPGIAPLGKHHKGPQEEHYHHYYVEPLPVPAKPLAPPTIVPVANGHAAHSYFSLQAPLLGTNIKYNHYWDVPKPLHV